MAISHFVCSSDNLPKLKAKQLFKTFRFLKLSVAQETTARALGYSSWYECIHHCSKGDPSLSDQDAGLSMRVARYYHQASALMGIGITPSEADRWVRSWGLTGHPTLAPEYGQPLYNAWNDALERFHRGEIDENRLLEEYGADAYSKYPDVDRPQRICAGVILGPMGRYPHYAVDPAIAARIPAYLRGPSSTYHYEDDGDVLAMCVPDFPKSNRSERIVSRLNRVQHEWHFGQKHPDASDLCVPNLVAAALDRPDELMVISQHLMPTPGGNYDANRHAVACLRGNDFAAFLRERGIIDPASVVWFRDVEVPYISFEWGSWLAGFDLGTERPPLPVFEGASTRQPSLPLYSYPFMTAPMSEDEYHAGGERICLLPLDEDYDGEEGEDEFGGDGDPPEDPDVLSPLRNVSRLQP